MAIETVAIHHSEIINLKQNLNDRLGQHGTANDVFEEEGSRSLNESLVAHAPYLHEKLQVAAGAFEKGTGCIVLRGLGIESDAPELAQLTSIAVSTAFGEPTRTDKHLAQIAWPVRFDPHASTRKTFSQTMGEARFHTDSQYCDNPERFFGLFCINADLEGKGTNYLIPGAAIVERISQENHENLIALRQPYPFRVPTVFTETRDDATIELAWAPIISGENDEIIRYRLDTLTDGVQITQKLSNAQLAAAIAFENTMADIPPIEYHLQPGEALIVDNHRMLHARTPYDDPNRLLYRVRMRTE